jgi:hypothetical protein
MDAKNASSTENNWRDRDRSPYFHARYTTLLHSDDIWAIDFFSVAIVFFSVANS